MKVAIYEENNRLVLVLSPESEVDRLACQQMDKHRYSVTLSDKIPAPLQEAQFTEGAISLSVDTANVKAASK